MASVTPAARPSFFRRSWPILLIALAGVAVYANSFSGPFVFDDQEAIPENPTIRHLWSIGAALSPPSGGLTVSGRPVLNLTLALNYAISGTNVWSYHAFNLAIHILAGLTLFGIVRRTLPSRESLAADGTGRNAGAFGHGAERASVSSVGATRVAFFVALLWTLHPLQTESVTYIIQRAESLMGLFYFLTIYCFIRSVEADGETKAWRLPLRSGSGSRRAFVGWAVLSVVACLCGMATKEVMVSAPIMVLLYDRTFVAGSFREAWRRRAPLYLGLASTWILLGGLVIGGGGGRGGSVGFGVDVPWRDYCLTQFQAIVQYVRLTLWPHPLVFEYGTFWAVDPGKVAFCACLVVPLIAATAVALWRWPAWGFLGFWFFAILAPTSLVPGTTQMIVEHRMYLALAPLLIAMVWPVFASGTGATAGPISRWGLAIFCAYAGVCGFLTARRNEDYRSELALWEDTAAKRPENALAQSNVATALEKTHGGMAEAVAQLQDVIRLHPDFAEAHDNLGSAWLEMPGKLTEAIAQFQEALRLKPNYPEAHDKLGKAWARLPGRQNDAIAEFQAALRLRPDFAEAHNDLGNAWSNQPAKLREAIAEFETVVRLRPDFAEAHNSLGVIWSNQPGRLSDAIAEYRTALRLKPDYPEAHNNLGDAWLAQPGRLDDATAEYRAALRLKPDYAEAHYNLGGIWLNQGRWNDAIAEYREALRLKPDLAEAHYNLGCALVNFPERLNDAISEFEAAVRLNPNYAEAHFNLAVALLHLPGHNDEAKAHLETVVRLRPDHDRARQILALLQTPPP